MDKTEIIGSNERPLGAVNKIRLAELDFLRTIGFVMVVAQHILGSYAGRPETGYMAASIFHAALLFGRPAVPMFIGLTAFTLFNSNYGKPMRLGTFFGKKSLNIILPYLFWSFFYLYFYHKEQLIRDLGATLLSGQASYHLWYVVMVVRLYLIFPLILLLVGYLVTKRPKLVIPVTVVALLGFYGLNEANAAITDGLVGLFGGGAYDFYLTRFLNYSPLYYSGYFILGAVYYFKREESKGWVRRYGKLLLIPYLPLSAYMYIVQAKKILPEWAEGVKNSHLIKVLFMMLTIVLLLRLALLVVERYPRWNDLFTRLGRLSFGAYLVHVLFLNEIAGYYWKLFHPKGNFIAGNFIFIATILLSFATSYILGKLPFCGYLVGIGNMKKASTKLLQK